MHLTLRTLLAYLDDTLEPEETQDIGRQISDAPPQIQDLIARVKRVMRQRRLLTPDAEGAGSQAVDPNTIAAYLDNNLSPEDMVALETLCLQSDVHLAEVAACHQIMTVAQSEPMPVPPTAHQTMYGLARGREAIATRVPPTSRHIAADGEAAESGESQFLGLPWLRFPGARGKRLVPIAAVLLVMAAGVVLLVAALNLSEKNRPTAEVGRVSGDGQLTQQGPERVPPLAAATGPEQPRGPVSTAPGRTPPVAPAAVALETVPTLWRDEGAGRDAKPEPSRAYCGSLLQWTGWVATRPSLPANGVLTLLSERIFVSTEPPPMPPPEPVKPPPATKPPPNPARIALAEYNAVIPKDSILVRRNGDGEWKTVKPMSRLQTGDLLVTLAGYRSEIVLDNRMRVQMVGTLPNPLPAAPMPNTIWESAITLHQNDNIDLDLTIERGRIIIFNKKPDSGTVRLRFLDQVWDLKLTQPASLVGVEIYSRLVPAGGKWQTVSHLTLLTAGGEVELTRGEKPETLAANQRVEWGNGPGAVAALPAQPNADLPVWLRAPYRWNYPDTTVAQTLLFQKRVAEKPAETKWLVEACREALDEKPLERYLALATLGAIDQLPLVFAALESDGAAELRRMAIETLWHWASSQPGREAALRDLLVKSDYSPANADLLIRLLAGYQPLQQESAKVMVEQLLRLLNHPLISVRELALFSLRGYAAPDLLRGYDPAAAEDQRVRAIEGIRQRLRLQ